MKLKFLISSYLLLFSLLLVFSVLYFDEVKNLLLFLLAAFGISILITEMLFRFFYRLYFGHAYISIPALPFKDLYIEPHPYVPFIYKKHATSQKGGPADYPLHKGRFFFIQTTTNNFRCNDGIAGDRDVIIPKPPEKTRVICLGASTTGNYIQEKNHVYSYPMQMENYLHDSGFGNIEVINFGQGGYNSADILSRFALHQIDCDPDVVVIYHAYNDIRNYLTENFESDYSHSRQNLGNTYWRYALASYFPDIPLKSYNFILNSLLSTNIRYSLLSEVSKGVINFQQDPGQGLKAYERNIQSIIDLCNARGIKVILSTYCHFLYEDIKNDETHKLYSKIVEQENGVMRKLSALNELQLVDNAKLIPQENTYFVDSVHFTPLGMTLIAENISKAVIKVLPVPKGH